MEKKTVKDLTKTGMAVSLGVLAWTGKDRCRRNKGLHTWAGIALVGFSVWHYNLYQTHDHKPHDRKHP